MLPPQSSRQLLQLSWHSSHPARAVMLGANLRLPIGPDARVHQADRESRDPGGRLG